jgi:hypothetical protein
MSLTIHSSVTGQLSTIPANNADEKQVYDGRRSRPQGFFPSETDQQKSGSADVILVQTAVLMTPWVCACLPGETTVPTQGEEMTMEAIDRTTKWRIHSAAGLIVLGCSSRKLNAQSVFKPFSANQVRTVGHKTTTGKVHAAR